MSINGAFEDFVVSQMAKGVSDKTVETYRSHFKSIGKYLDTEITFDALRQTDLVRMVVAMRQNGLTQNSISSYLRVFRTFLHGCARQFCTALHCLPLPWPRSQSLRSRDSQCQGSENG